MDVKYKAAQLGFGQLGKPWFEHVSKSKAWAVELIDKKEDLLKSSYDFIFLAVRDDSLSEIISQLKILKTPLYHFSGSLYFDEAVGIHPIYSFGNSLKKIDFRSMDWVCDSKVHKAVEYLIGSRRHKISPELKKIYHAHLSIAANMSQLFSYLMAESFEQKTKLSKELLKNLLIQSLKNEKEFGEKSFSGPWVRGEKALQDKIIESLNDRFLTANNKNFNELIEVYNEHYRL
jgi:hypothetical protein